MNWRSTRSRGRSAASSAIVVRFGLPRTAPERPSSRIRRSTVQRATRMAFAVELRPDLRCAIDPEVLGGAPGRSRLSARRRGSNEPTSVGVSPTNTSTGRTATPRRSARPRNDHDARRCRRSSLPAVELGREETRRALENLVRPAQLPVLPLERSSAAPAHRTSTRPDDPRRSRPAAPTSGPSPPSEASFSATDRIASPLRPGAAARPRRPSEPLAFTHLHRVPPRPSPFCHGSILPRDRACALPGEVQGVGGSRL